MSEPTVIELLRDVQERQDPFGQRQSFEEWRVEKQRGGQPGMSISGFTGHLSTSSRAPAGPAARRSGMQGVGLSGSTPPDRDPFFGQQYGVEFGSQGPSQSRYVSERPFQPPPFIDDVDMRSVWWSPMEPVWPYGPPFQSRPREWQFPVGYNLNFIQPRMELMKQLRGMRASWGLLSTVETTRQDQLLRLPWTIQRRDKPKANSHTVDDLKRFFKRPDGKLTFGQWARKLMFDLFDIDAPYLYLDRGNTGKINHVEVLDGATIFPLIDDAGRRPGSEVEIDPSGLTYLRRQPAYQQIIYGLPMINLSEDEIIYSMMRPRPEMPMFGYSPVEQILVEATEGIRKTFYQLEFWRSGSIPELIVSVPDTWTPRHIAMYQAHFDALLSGQLSLKSKVRFVPGGMKPFDIKNASGESLWSQRDELLARLVCFAFSIPPTPFVRQMNRATAQTAQQTAQEEGLYPLMSWWKDDIMDTIIQDKLGFDDIEFVFLPRPEVDLLKQAQIHQIKLHSGEMLLDEARDENGQEPLPDGMGQVPLVYFGSGAVRLEDIISGKAILPGSPQSPDQGQDTTKPTSDNSASNVPMRGPAKPHGSSPLPQPESKKLLSPPDARRGVPLNLSEAVTKISQDNATREQRTAGNYKKEHLRIHGLDISIENPKGSVRDTEDEFGRGWSGKIPFDYGYIRGTIGADDQQVDICVGKKKNSPDVFVIDQDKISHDDLDQGFDEHKVMIWFKDGHKAYKEYCKGNTDGKGPLRCGVITRLSFSDFKSWLKTGDLKRPISEQGIGQVIHRRGDGVWKDASGGQDTISSSTGHLWYDQGQKKKRKKKKARSSSSSGPRWLELAAE